MPARGVVVTGGNDVPRFIQHSAVLAIHVAALDDRVGALDEVDLHQSTLAPEGVTRVKKAIHEQPDFPANFAHPYPAGSHIEASSIVGRAARKLEHVPGFPGLEVGRNDAEIFVAIGTP